MATVNAQGLGKVNEEVLRRLQRVPGDRYVAAFAAAAAAAVARSVSRQYKGAELRR